MLKTHGQALSEYGLALGVVAVACVISVMLLGGQLSNIFGSTIQNNNSPPPSSPQIAHLTPLPVPEGTGIGNVVPPPAHGQQQACLSNGVCFNVPVIAQGTLVDPTGGNGGELTTQFANMLDSIAQQLKADNADPNMVAWISQIALNGHTMAAGESKSPTRCLSEIASGGSCAQIPTPNIDQANADILNLLSNPPANLDPQTMGIIQSATSEMSTIADAFKAALKSMSSENPSPIVNSATTLTTINANTVCATGGVNCTVQVPTATSETETDTGSNSNT